MSEIAFLHCQRIGLTQVFPITAGLDSTEANKDRRHPMQKKRKARARLTLGYWSVSKEYVVSVRRHDSSLEFEFKAGLGVGIPDAIYDRCQVKWVRYNMRFPYSFLFLLVIEPDGNRRRVGGSGLPPTSRLNDVLHTELAMQADLLACLVE